MTGSARTKLALFAVALFLAGLSAAGALIHTHSLAVAGSPVPTAGSSHSAPTQFPSPSGENDD
jgi:hypothetical protein